MKKIFFLVLSASLLLLAACSKDKDVEQKKDVVNNNVLNFDVIKKTFSVSPIKTVLFSKGNLQYNASTDTWRFAENQWDYVGSPSQKPLFFGVASGTVEGSDNANIGKDGYTGWIDLFCWGTGNSPAMVTTVNSYSSLFYEWGDNANLKRDLGMHWYTLSSEEWSYLIGDSFKRRDKYGFATIDSVVGLVLLPDYWDGGIGDEYNFIPGCGKNWNTNTYNSITWAKMENAGAVFLPIAGSRTGQKIGDIGFMGYYWSSTPCSNSGEAYCFSFYSNSVVVSNKDRFFGLSVRLVKESNQFSSPYSDEYDEQVIK